MKTSNLKKVLTLITLFLMLGQTLTSTVQVLADNLPTIQQSSEKNNVTEQRETPNEETSNTEEIIEKSLKTPALPELDETNQANAPPVESSTQDGSLTVGSDGNIYYNDEPLFYPDGEVPANMEQLFKEGLPTRLYSRAASAGTSSASIEYRGPVTWGYHTVGDFRVNNKQAFCIQHPKGTPPTGTPNNGAQPYANPKIQAVLYWGWGGPKNIFSDSAAGIVATSLALSHFYYGDSYNSLPSGYTTLLAKANAGDVPSHLLQINQSNKLVNLPVTFDATTGIQKSATATLNADSSNSITFSIPSGITFVNETSGAKATSGNVTVKGGQKYHFEAKANVQATISHKSLKGTLKEFQPLVVKPVSSSLQTLGTWQWYDDPTQTVSFEAKFIKRNGHVQLNKMDADTGAKLQGAKFEYTINDVTKTGTTNANGVLNINDILDGTKITIKEVLSPTGYVLNSTPQTVTVKAGETVKVSFTNKKIIGSVKLIKYADKEVGTETPNTLLEGAEFTLLSSDGKTTISKGTTNNKGEILFSNIEYGDYILRETKTPTGYDPVADISVSIKENGKTIEIKATDKIKYNKVQIKKVDLDTGAVLKGAEFSYIYNSTKGSVVTDDQGIATIPNVPHGAVITVTEVKAPTGYVLNTTPQKVTLDSNKVAELTFTNKKIIGSIQLTKFTDLNWTNGTISSRLEKAEFSLFKKGSDKALQVKTTDSKGLITFSGVEYGDYIIKETKTPEGYLPVSDMSVSIREDGKVIEVAGTDKVIREDMKLIKYDDGSNLSILSQDAQFEITNLQTNKKINQKDELGQETTIFVTNDQGEILLSKLPYGHYQIEEIKAPFGYLQLHKPVEFFINGKNNGLLTVKIGNKIVKGQVDMAKTGEKVTVVEFEETDYGTLYHTSVSQEPLKDVTFDISAREDIVTGDGKVQHEAGDLVGTYITDEEGKFTSDQLYIGAYFAKEKAAPNGFIIKDDEIDFTINYEGQLVPLTSSSIEAENSWNRAKVIIHKVDETLIGYEDNHIQTEEVASTNKVFGLFRNDAYSFNDVELLPKDALVGIATTIDGQATFEGQYPDGDYYAKELDSGDSHVINETKYPIVLTPTDNREELESNVFESGTFLNNENMNRMARLPIVNKLFLTSVPFEKINETSKLDESKGYIYEYNQLGEGAEFELKDSGEEVIQTAIIDEDGKGIWKDLIVGHYTFRETKTSNDTLVLDETIYGIEVSQEKTVITDMADGSILVEIDHTEKDEPITDLEKIDNEDIFKEDETLDSDGNVDQGDNESEEISQDDFLTPIITFKNKAIRGKSELEKTDVSTGKKLPNTGIEIKDEQGKTIVTGRTDLSGKFIFDNLPKGKYTFTEFDAPEGYNIDTTPIPFEIKEDGEIIKCSMTNEKIETPEKPKENLPQTGEDSHSILTLIGLVLSVSLFIAYYLLKRKQHQTK